MAGRKGSTFEREFCYELSNWWSDGEEDDIFWRSQASGGRATTRSKTGKRTSGHYGDVAATDARGAPLINLLTIELKRGYSSQTMMDVLDRNPKMKLGGWEGFLSQAINSHTQAGSFAWLLYTRRDRRTGWFYFPTYLLNTLRAVGAFPRSPRPAITASINVREGKTSRWHNIYGTTKENFFRSVTPDHIREVAKWQLPH